jgi:hypothetical protein
MPPNGRLLRASYARDDNADPRVYYLRPRTAEFKNLLIWREIVERALGDFLRRAAQGLL